MITNPSIWGALRDRADNNVFELVGSGAPTSGASGTGVGFAGPGSTYTDVVTGYTYKNTNTISSPTWSLSSVNGITGDVTFAAGVSAIGANKVTDAMLAVPSAFGLGVVRYAKSVWSFAVDGGAQGAILPVSGAILPAKAIVLGGVLDIVTTCTSSGSGTMAIGTSAGSAANSILAATAVASLAAGVSTVLIPKFTAATIFKMTALGSIQFTIATADFIGGKAGLTLAYVVGD